MEELNFLAKVGDKVITQEDLEAAVASLDGYQRQQFDNEEGRKRILADMINQELFYLDAIENKMDQDEIFVNEMELVKANMLKQYAINACLAAVEITDDELLAIHEKRFSRILDIALTNNNDVVILGAFGCGAFENNTGVVATAAKNVVEKYIHAFRVIEFAVYCSPRDSHNYDVFKSVLGNMNQRYKR